MLLTTAVTVRKRDTMEQVRMPISELKSYIESKIEFKKYLMHKSGPPEHFRRGQLLGARRLKKWFVQKRPQTFLNHKIIIVRRAAYCWAKILTSSLSIKAAPAKPAASS